jgi:hypothetical protein
MRLFILHRCTIVKRKSSTVLRSWFFRHPRVVRRRPACRSVWTDPGISRCVRCENDVHVILDIVEASCNLGLDRVSRARKALADLVDRLTQTRQAGLHAWPFFRAKNFIETNAAYVSCQGRFMSAFESGNIECTKKASMEPNGVLSRRGTTAASSNLVTQSTRRVTTL